MDDQIHRNGFTKLSSAQNSGNKPVLNAHSWPPRSPIQDVGYGSPQQDTPKVRSSWNRMFSRLVTQGRSRTPGTHTDDDSTDVFWPRDFLLEDFQKSGAVVWLYGYDADIIGFFGAKSKDSISQHGQKLFLNLERDIDNELPFVFIVHSLGGIILKDALRRSSDSAARPSRQPEGAQSHIQPQSSIKKTRLIIFLGTPHRGSKLADWTGVMTNLAAVALQDPNKKLLAGLRVNSEILDNIHEQFKNLICEDKYNIHIHSFQEDSSMTGVKGVVGKVVDDYSSKLDFPTTIETVESSPGNHRQIAIFAHKHDQGYQDINKILTKLFKHLSVQTTESQALHLTRVQRSARVRKVQSADRAVARDGSQQSTPSQRATPPTQSRGTEPTSHQVAFRDNPPIARHASRNRNRLFEVPLPANQRFTGREDIIKSMEYDSRRLPLYFVTLVGLGGCGKTEIALQYSHQYCSRYFGVYWIDATSEFSIRGSFKNLRRQLKALSAAQEKYQQRGTHMVPISPNSRSTLPINDPADDENAFSLRRAVHSTDDVELMHQLPGSWLFVFDNMDDSGILPVMELLMNSLSSGMCIVTTRNRAAAKLGRFIDVPMMSVEDSARFLVRSIHHSRSLGSTVHRQAKDLAERLGNLPLAIDQAAAYINFRQWTIHEYLEAFDEEPDYLLGRSSDDRYSLLQNEPKYDNVLKTGELSFRQIEESNSAAAELLQLLGFLYHADIHEEMFTQKLPPAQQWSSSGEKVPLDIRRSGLPAGLQACLGNNRKFGEACGPLLNLSLVKRKLNKKRIWIHPLVHYWAYARLSDTDRSRWLHIAFLFLSHTLPLEQQWPVLKNTEPSMAANNHIQFLLEKTWDVQLPRLSSNVVPVLCAASKSTSKASAEWMQTSFEALSKHFDDPTLHSMLELWILIDRQDLTRGLSEWDRLINASSGRSGMHNSLLLHFAVELSILLPRCKQGRSSRAYDPRKRPQSHRQHKEDLLAYIEGWKPNSESFLEHQAARLKNVFLLTVCQPRRIIIDFGNRKARTSTLYFCRWSRELETLFEVALIRLSEVDLKYETLMENAERVEFLILHSHQSATRSGVKSPRRYQLQCRLGYKPALRLGCSFIT